jgi:hypothetical protein
MLGSDASLVDPTDRAGRAHRLAYHSQLGRTYQLASGWNKCACGGKVLVKTAYQA